jgi:hypothetical protein
MVKWSDLDSVAVRDSATVAVRDSAAVAVRQKWQCVKSGSVSKVAVTTAQQWQWQQHNSTPAVTRFDGENGWIWSWNGGIWMILMVKMDGFDGKMEGFGRFWRWEWVDLKLKWTD